MRHFLSQELVDGYYGGDELSLINFSELEPDQILGEKYVKGGKKMLLVSFKSRINDAHFGRLVFNIIFIWGISTHILFILISSKIGSLLYGCRPWGQLHKTLKFLKKMSDKGPLSFLFVIPITDGRGSWPFPSQLRENLFQNSVRVRGLYSTKQFKDSFLFTISNASEHMACGKKVITNVLGIFNFAKQTSFKLMGLQ